MTRDQDLARRLAEGDTAALDVLLERYWDVTCRVAARLTGDPDLAADVAQDAFVRVLQRARSYDPRRAFKPWFFQIVRNLAADQRRARERRRRRERAVARPERLEPTRSDDEALRAELAALDPDVRAAVTLKYLADLTYPEVADALGCPEGTATSRVRRGLETLRERLGAERAAGFAPWLAAIDLDAPRPRAAALLAHVARPQRGGVVLTVVAALLVVTAAGAWLAASPGGPTGPALAAGPQLAEVEADGPAHAPGAHAPAPDPTTAASPLSAPPTPTGDAAGDPSRADAEVAQGVAHFTVIDAPADTPLVNASFELDLLYASRDGARAHMTRALTTDGEGRCSLELPRRTYGVRARVGERWSERRWLDLSDGDDDAELSLRAPGGELLVRVTDDRGHPVPGAAVRLFDADLGAINAPFGIYAQVPDAVWVPRPSPTLDVTDADGALRLPGVEPSSYLVVARHGGRVGREHPVTLARVGERVEVTLALDATCPLADLRYRIRVADPSRLQGPWGAYASIDLEPAGVLSSAEVGKEKLWQDLPAGEELTLTFSVAGHAPRTERFTLQPGEERTLELFLDAQAPLRGRVLLPDGEPAQGGEARVAGSHFVFDLDGDGRFELERLPEQPRLDVTVEVPGWLGEVFPALDPSVEQTLRWPDTPRARWTLLGPNGEPLAGARVSYGGRQGRSDSAGEIWISGVPTEVQHTLRVDLDRQRFVEQRAFSPGSAARITLGQDDRPAPDPCRVAGRVVDTAGAPLAGVLVVCNDGARDETGPDGTFAFTGVSSERSIELHARRLDLAPAGRSWEPMAGGVYEGLTLTLQPGRPVRLRLVGESAAEVTWLTVRRTGDRDPTHELQVPSVQLDLGQLSPGAWELVAQRYGDELGRLTVEVSPGAGPLELELTCD